MWHVVSHSMQWSRLRTAKLSSLTLIYRILVVGLALPCLHFTPCLWHKIMVCISWDTVWKIILHYLARLARTLHSQMLVWLVQNNTHRNVTSWETRKNNHIRPVLRGLRWHSVRKRIVYKMAVMVYKCLHGMAPPLHIWPLTACLWRQWPDDDISSLLCPVASLSLEQTLDLGLKILQSLGLRSGTVCRLICDSVNRDMRAETDTVLVPVPWAHLRILILRYTNLLSIIKIGSRSFIVFYVRHNVVGRSAGGGDSEQDPSYWKDGSRFPGAPVSFNMLP